MLVIVDILGKFCSKALDEQPKVAVSVNVDVGARQHTPSPKTPTPHWPPTPGPPIPTPFPTPATSNPTTSSPTAPDPLDGNFSLNMCRKVCSVQFGILTHDFTPLTGVCTCHAPDQIDTWLWTGIINFTGVMWGRMWKSVFAPDQCGDRTLLSDPIQEFTCDACGLVTPQDYNGLDNFTTYMYNPRIDNLSGSGLCCGVSSNWPGPCKYCYFHFIFKFFKQINYSSNLR